MRSFFLVLSLVLVFLPSCKNGDEQAIGRRWTEREIKELHGKTPEEVRELLGKPDGFYTRLAEGRWHYSDIVLDTEGAGQTRRVWIVIYFSRFGEHRATLVEIHDHTEGEE